MLASILRAAGLRAPQRRQRRHPAARGGAAPRALRRPRRRAVQLPAALAALGRPPVASACLNVAPDHVDWHGSLDEYRAGQGPGLREHRDRLRLQRAGPGHRAAGEEAEVVEGCRAVGFTLGIPRPVDARLVDDVLADRAFVEQRRTSAAELATLADLQRRRPRPRAALRRQRAGRRGAGAGATASPPVAVRDGLRAFVPDRAPHRRRRRRSTGSRCVDDSKATNPHAAAASLLAFEHVVWVAGGLLKGADVDDLVRRTRPTGCAASC